MTANFVTAFALRHPIDNGMSFKPIENYGVIGNLATAALVSIDCSIDFFCFPEFDSPTIFAALLDPEKGGSFSFRPCLDDMNSKQMYMAETNILTTRFMSDTATAELTDFMPIKASRQKTQIVRSVQVIHGEVEFEVHCRPAFDYARTCHGIEIHGDCAIFIPENSNCPTLALRGTVPLQEWDGAATARFTLREKESAVFILGSLEEEGADSSAAYRNPESSSIDLQEIASDLDSTREFWRQWIGKSTYKGRWREAVNRSALVLKLMVSRRHGSLVASPTFGLPEHVGGARNWDYRFTWIRDAAFTLYAFMRLGLRSEAESFFGWLEKQVGRSDDAVRPMQIMYGLDGRTDLEEFQLDHLRGYRDSRPVRIGNGAYNQLQLDIYGEVFDAIYLYSKYGHALPHDGWLRMKGILEWLGRNWCQPDEGIWEVRGGNKHFLHSRLMCWVAFDRAIRLAHKRSLSAPLPEWYQHRENIVNDIYGNFWNEKIKAFTQHKDTEALDGAVLLMPLLRFISPVDPRWLSTLNAIEQSLSEDALVYRYRPHETSDGLMGEEGSFTCCSFWFVECLARAGQVSKAHGHFEKLLAHANHVGLFSEEIGRDGHQLGNFPQALSHLALISAAVYLDRVLSGRPSEAWA